MTAMIRRDWFAVLAGPLAWFVAHVASWMLAPGAHDGGSIVGFVVIDAAALAIAIAGGVLALGRLRALRRVRLADTAPDRARVHAPDHLPEHPPDHAPDHAVDHPPGHSPDPALARRTQRDLFLAASGLALSALSIVLVVGLALPILLLTPGAEP